MKNLIAILIALATPFILLSQNAISKNYPLEGAKTVKIQFQYGDVTIEKQSGAQITLEGRAMINGISIPEKFEFNVQKSGGSFVLRSEADFEKLHEKLPIVKHDSTQIYNGLDIDVAFVLRIPSGVNLEVQSTYGDVLIIDYWKDMHIHSTFGSVDVVLHNAPANPHFKVSSTYSEVDLTIPQSSHASLRMKTSYGKVYTDLDLETEYKERDKSHNFGEDISAKINSGSGLITLEAQYSNIYLRKTKE